MTNEQINAAIETALRGNENWIKPRDYCNNLNAMHEAENHLGEHTNMVDYTNALYDMACAAQKKLGKWEEIE